MTSPAKRAANRHNARKSTGPRTRAGKDRASRSALRHGFTIDICVDPAVAPQIEHIAHALAGPQSAERDVLDTARLAAMAELDLVRIRRIRSGLLKDLALSIAAMDTDTDETSVFEKVPVLQVILNGIQAELSATEMFNDLEKWERRSKGPPSSRVSVAIAELVRIERYERRPMSRRKRLFRALDVLRRGPDS